MSINGNKRGGRDVPGDRPECGQPVNRVHESPVVVLLSAGRWRDPTSSDHRGVKRTARDPGRRPDATLVRIVLAAAQRVIGRADRVGVPADGLKDWPAIVGCVYYKRGLQHAFFVERLGDVLDQLVQHGQLGCDLPPHRVGDGVHVREEVGGRDLGSGRREGIREEIEAAAVCVGVGTEER